MLFKLIIALASALICAQSVAAATCHDYVLITVRGTGEPQGPSIAFKNMTANTLKDVANGTQYDLPYPATFVSNSAAMGYNNLTSYISKGLKSCPSQKYALLGYSQGASVVELALADYAVGSAAYNAILAIFLVGNPGHKPFQQANIDQYGVLLTNMYFGSLYNKGARVPVPWYQSTKVLDVCYTGDVVCAPQYPNGTIINHLQYGSTPSVQTMGTNFLVGALTPAYIGKGSAYVF